MTLAVRICLMLAVPQASAFAFSGGRMVQPRVQAAAAHAPLQPALRAAPVQMADAPPPPQERKSSVPFFLDIGTKGGIVFYSIVGCVLPFVAYNFMLDTLQFDIVLAGNVILVGCKRAAAQTKACSPHPPF